MVLKIKGRTPGVSYLSLASGVFLLFFGLCVIIGCVVSNLSINNKRILGKIDMCSDST